jgi:hypothetical protein
MFPMEKNELGRSLKKCPFIDLRTVRFNTKKLKLDRKVSASMHTVMHTHNHTKSELSSKNRRVCEESITLINPPEPTEKLRTLVGISVVPSHVSQKRSCEQVDQPAHCVQGPARLQM